MKNDHLNGLIALKAVAEKRNFTAAAETLGITASAISQTIKQLEKRLGVTLLSRTTRNTNLTEAGIRFMTDAGPALDQLLTAMQGLGSYADKPSGLLRINMPRSFYSVIAPSVARFTRMYPEVSIELFFDDDIADVVERGFDAGIRLSELMDKDMVAFKLTAPFRFVTAASPKYLNRMGRPKHPKDLLAHNCIRIRIGESELYDRWEFEHRGKEFEVKVDGSLILNDTGHLMNAVCDGLGISYFVEELIRDQLESGKLEAILEPYASISNGLYLYYPKRSQMMPKLRAFVDHLRGEGFSGRRNLVGND